MKNCSIGSPQPHKYFMNFQQNKNLRAERVPWQNQTRRFFRPRDLNVTRGFALMFAVLATSVLLSIAIAIFNISLREVILSSFGRESESALYAADSGAECALYWNRKSDAFATGTASQITCSEQTFTVGGGGENDRTSRFKFSLGNTLSAACVDVTVTKSYADQDNNSVTPDILETSIKSYGHNTCVLSNPRRVERAFQVTF